ncbi:hypothetical protein NKH16_27360 [Mesorhizobium sp. M1307]|uniref:glycosyltransferase family 9 protein n=1 Tax=Mesorhizobium sp. M1307 TaxID=2957079 RepID=UPI003334DC3E
MLQNPPTHVRSILILQTKFIGDLVLASALARNLRLQYPNARIVFLCEANFASFLLAHGIASDVVAFRRVRMRGTPVQRGRELYAMVRALRRFRFDLTIDLAIPKPHATSSGSSTPRPASDMILLKNRCAGWNASPPTS